MIKRTVKIIYDELKEAWLKDRSHTKELSNNEP